MIETIAATALSYLLNEWNKDQAKGDVEAFKTEQNALTDKENRSARRGFMDDLLSSQGLAEKNIKQVGAAKRLPSGAVGTALAENRGQTSRAIDRFESGLADKKIGSYKSINDQYYQSIFNLNNQSNLTNQAYLGNLSKVFMLWNAGYFNNNNSTEVPLAGGGFVNNAPGSTGERYDYWGQ